MLLVLGHAISFAKKFIFTREAGKLNTGQKSRVESKSKNYDTLGREKPIIVKSYDN